MATVPSLAIDIIGRATYLLSSRDNHARFAAGVGKRCAVGILYLLR